MNDTAMNHFIPMEDVRSKRQMAEEEILGLLIGIGFTLMLFVGMAHFEKFGTPESTPLIDEVRMVAMPLEPPPPLPKQETPEEVSETVLPFAGLEIGASDSPVSIAVVPPDMESLIPTTTSPPRARIQLGVLHSEFKPKVDMNVDVHHVYQETEVDQKPRALVRAVPTISSEVSGNAPFLRVQLLLLIGQNGKPESVRVMRSSGNPQFDTIVATTVKNEWLFSPGIRRGKKVRVMAQQGFRITFTSGTSPFSLEK